MARQTVSRFTAVDCFAGCGGMSEGLRQAGFDVIGAIESDHCAASVYQLNHPTTRMFEVDIRTICGADLRSSLKLRKGQLDLLGGCPPCQGFSSLRTLNGNKRITDTQNDLIFEFERLIRELNPKHVMLENVPALAADTRLKRFCATLLSLGFRFEHKILDVADYGVPQRRRRLVLLASRKRKVEFAPVVRHRKTVRNAIGGLPEAGTSGDLLHDLPEKRSQVVRERIRNIPPDGGSRKSLPGRLSLDCHDRTDGFKDVYGRMAWESLAPTITTGCFNPSKGRFLHPDAHRAITMREAALLQSFPMRYKFPASMGKVRLATMIGNALPPKFICAHARSLISS